MVRSSTEVKRVLVVDDDEASASLLSELLQQTGRFVATVALSGGEALRALDEDAVDGVLLDVDLGDTSGLTVLATIREQRSPLALPVVMVTGHDSSKEVAAALRAGANDYVAKPIDVDVLLARLSTHMHLAELARLKDDALRMASHDLKNPLTAVIGNAGLILDSALGEPVDEDLHESARAILRRASYMQRLICDFLDMQAARDGQLQLELAPVSLGQLASEVVEEQADYASARGLVLAVTGQAAVARADVSRLSQVLHNLVGNAVKFANRRGRVDLVTSATSTHAIIEVRDDGPGLGDDPDRLFTPHVRGNARPAAGERSTGLGLSIARVLVEQHGGRISAANRQDGPGAVFRVELPLA